MTEFRVEKRRDGSKYAYSLSPTAKHKEFADVISLRTPEEAKLSVIELKGMFAAGSKEQKLKILRATQLAANCAKAALERKELSSREREEFRQIAKIYEDASEYFESRCALLAV